MIVVLLTRELLGFPNWRLSFFLGWLMRFVVQDRGFGVEGKFLAE